MSLKILVVDEYKELLREPYVVRLGGWTWSDTLRRPWKARRCGMALRQPAPTRDPTLEGGPRWA
jgi:hypothetical protein